MNYFELFEIPISLQVNSGLIKKKYYELIKKYHPDYNGGNNEIVTYQNLLLSSKVNEGYKLFQNEFDTLGYVLSLLNSILPNEKYVLPQEFLLEMMELNEQIKDGLNEVILLKKNELRKPVVHLFSTDIYSYTKNDLDLLKEYYYKIKYLNKLQKRVNGKEDLE